MDVHSREYVFAIELMASVMELYCIKMKPNKSLLHTNQSPFTPVVKKAVEYIWREKEEFIEDLFNTVLHMGTINMSNYKSAMEFASHLVIEAEYDEIELLRFCVIASGYASIFFLGGLEHVPSQCIKLIYNTIMSFRAKNQFTDESWHDIEILGGAYSEESLGKEDVSKPTSACFIQASENKSSDNFLQIDVYTAKFKTNTVDKYKQIFTKSSCNNLEKEFPQTSNNVESVGYSKDNEIVSQIENASENINTIVYKTKKDNVIKQETNEKIKGIKRKKTKSFKHKTKSDTDESENFASEIKQLPKNVIENNDVLLNSEEIISEKIELKYNKKVSKINYIAGKIKNVKYRAPISEIKVTAKDPQRNKCGNFKMTKDDYENISDFKDGFKDLSMDGDIAERNKTAYKIPKKIKLSKYKTHKFKGKSCINKKKKRQQVKEHERNMDSSEDSAITNTASQYLFEEKYDIVGKCKKRKVIKNKSKKSNTKKKFKNENSYKNVPLTLYTSDEYVDVLTTDENVNVVRKNEVAKKGKYNTKSFKNIAIKDVDEFKRMTRKSTREKNATNQKHQPASTSTELQPHSSTRSPGCEISNLINVSESEKSESILNKFFENFRSKMRKSKESEHKVPKT